MASDVSAKSSLSEEAPQAAPSEALELADSPSNGAYRLKVAKSIDILPGGRKLLAVTTLLCIALFAVGIRFGRRGLLREQSSQSIPSPSSYSQQDVTEGVAYKTAKLGEVVSTVDADRFSVARKIEEQEERIAALKRAVEDAKQSLRRKEERFAGMEKELNGGSETSQLLQDAIRELSVLEAKGRHSVSSQKEASKLVQAIESAKVELAETEAQDYAKSLELQRGILQREEALATQRERELSEKKRQSPATLESKMSTLKHALDSVVGAIAEHRIKLEATEDVNTQVEQLASTLEDLEGRANDLKTLGSDMQHWQHNFDDASLMDAVLRGKFRKLQAAMLVSSQMRAQTLAQEIDKELMSYQVNALDRSQAESFEGEMLAERVNKIMEQHVSAADIIPDRMATNWDIIRNIAVVKLGVSELLNNRQLAWELSQATKVCQLKGEKVVVAAEESESEIKRVEAVKEELRRGLEQAQYCEANQAELASAQEEADFLLEDCKLKEAPDRILVREFKSVDSDGADQGVDAEFRILRALGKGGSGVIVEVEPVDEELKRKVGTLAMKMLRQESKEDKGEIEANMEDLESTFLSEKDALKKIALEGESAAAVTERTGVIGAHYTGKVEGLYVAIRTSDDNVVVSFDSVIFTPVIALDIINFFTNPSEGLSMESRVYMAHSLLKTMAHIHKAGVVHNDIRLENAGITADGRIVVFDCANFDKPGSPRMWFSAPNTSPESAELRLRGVARSGSFHEDAWGVGFMLYMVFSEGIPAFHDSNPEFLHDVVTYRAVKAEWLMHNIESPAHQLRRYGVPEVWIQAISLLLERNGEHRPSVLQVLEALPDLSKGPFHALDKENKAL